MRAVRFGNDYRRTVIGIGPDVNMQRNLAEKRNPQTAGGFAGAFMTEDIGAGSAFFTNIIAHIFDNAQNRYVNAFEHIDALDRINQRNILRR